MLAASVLVGDWSSSTHNKPLMGHPVRSRLRWFAPPVNVSFTLDHQANATTVGVDLPPTSLIVFGNPSLGSILMQADQSVALDLPQKMLIFGDSAGAVSIAYNDPAWLAKCHGLRKSGAVVAEVLATLDGALSNFAGIGAQGDE